MNRQQLWQVAAASLVGWGLLIATDAGDVPPVAGSTPSSSLAVSNPASVSVASGGAVEVIERSNPKVIGVVPAGWKIVPLEGAKMESDPIEVRPGITQVIQVSPYKLVPEEPRIGVKEPGFNPKLGNAQTGTIGAALTRYNEEAAQLATELEAAIKTLSAILPGPANSAAAGSEPRGAGRTGSPGGREGHS